MPAKLLIACVLVAITVAVHAAGLSLVLRSLTKSRAVLPTQAWPITWLFIRVTWVLLLTHAIEITVWALFYLWWECLPDAESAFYFFGVTYATILPKPWRMLAPIEGVTGILMFGLSAGLFVALASRIFAARSEPTRK
jgi:hypothetical protein